MAYKEWLQSTGVPWLTGNLVGRSYWAAIGGALDDEVSQIIQATQASFPDSAPPDALPALADEFQMDQVPGEPNATFATRLRTAWSIWPYAGSSVGLLLALYYAGFPNAVVVQQNGTYAQLVPPLNPADYTTNFQFGNQGPNPAIAGAPPWWMFDFNNAYGSRFAVLFPGTLPGPFRTTAAATFTGVENSVAVTWNNLFADATYKVMIGPPTITDANGPVAIDFDPTTKTASGLTVRTSSPFAGTVELLAYQSGAGVNPFVDLHPADLARLQRTIRRWRPAKAVCVGVYAAVQGRFFGWPVTPFNNAPFPSITFGPGTAVFISPGS
jgi:hypothetical protein